MLPLSIIVVHCLFWLTHDPLVLLYILQAVTYVFAAIVALLGHRPALAFAVYMVSAFLHFAVALAHGGVLP